MYNKVFDILAKCNYIEGEMAKTDWDDNLTADHQKALFKFIKEAATPFRFLARDDPKRKIEAII